MVFLKQSTAVDLGIGPFLDQTDGFTAEPSLTITAPDIRLKKNGGAFAQKNAAQTLTHEENGWYEVALDTTDTNTLGILIIAIHESGALPVWKEYQVVPANVYDSIVGGTDFLDVNATQHGGTAQTGRDIGLSVLLSSGTGTGQLKLAAGYVAMTLADVGAPTTTVNLSGTTIKTATDVETDTANIQTRIPAALTAGGDIKADVLAISGDTTAADNLETMLDGTGGQTFTLKSMVISNPAGVGLVVSGSTAGAQFDGVASGGLVVTGEYGLWASGVSAGARFDSSATGPGLECVGGTTGSGLEATGGATSGPGIKTTGVGAFAGIVAEGGPTGRGIEAIGGVTSGFGMFIAAQGGNSHGLVVEADGSGSDISADLTGNITGNLSGSAGSVTAVSAGAITTASFAAGAIDAAAIAPDAIGASELATSAVSEIVAGIGGVGAFAITVTVLDQDTQALQNVTVTIFDGGGAVAGRGTTNASGQASFSLAAGTYTVALVKSNYNFAPVSRTVTGNQAGSIVTALSMTIIAAIAPSGTPGMCVVAGYIKDLNGAALVGSTVTARLKPAVEDRPITSDGVVVSLEVEQAVTNGIGYVSMELIRTDELDQTCAYNISCADADMHIKGVKLEAATKDIADL